MQYLVGCLCVGSERGSDLVFTHATFDVCAAAVALAGSQHALFWGVRGVHAQPGPLEKLSA